jgi:peptide/nickel transport system substrate-binding protein
MWIFDALATEDENGPKPCLAESWKFSPDGKDVTMRLVRNATWHDGVGFTSADVKWSMEESITKYSAYGNLFQCSVTTPDDYTVILHYADPINPSVFVHGLLSFSSILPKHLYEGKDLFTNPYNWKPIGTGPFIFKEYVEGDHMIAVRNPNYFMKDLPYLDKVVVKMIPSTTARAVALEKGEVDVTMKDMGYADVKRLQSDARFVVDFVGVKGMTVPLYLNCRNEVTGKKLVRKAIAHALNLEELVSKVTLGVDKVPTGFVSSSVKEFYNPNVPTYPYDPGKAKKLLDEAGYPAGADGKRFTLKFVARSDVEEYASMATMIKEWLEQVGIRINFVPVDKATALSKIAVEWDYDVALLDTAAAGPDPGIQGEKGYGSKYIKRVPWSNEPGYSNPRVDELFGLANQEVDPAKRKKYFDELQVIIADDVPVIHLREKSLIYAHNRDFVGIPWRMPGAHTMRPALESVWWIKGESISPTAAAQELTSAKERIERLKAQFCDVTGAESLLSQARSAYEKGEYLKAWRLAREATDLVTPPYSLYVAIAVVVVVIVASFMCLRRRRMRR